MPYDKYERGHQHVNGSHWRITYKEKEINKNKNNTYPTAYPKQSMSRCRQSVRIHLLNSPPMTGKVEKNKMIVMMTMMYKR